jgi:two-component sensor histidine kinase
MTLVPAALAYPLQLIGRDRGLPSVQVHDLSLDANNALWVAGPNGLAKVNDQRIRCMGRRDGLRSHGLRCVEAGADGRIWVGGDGGVDVLGSDGQLEDNTEPWRFGVVEKICVRDDYVLAATSSGMQRWSAETGWAVEGSRLGTTYVNQLVSTASGSIWISGPQIGLRIGGPDSWREPIDDQWRTLGALSAIVPTAAGTVFVGGSSGAAEYSDTGEFIRSVWFQAKQEGTISALWCFGDELWAGVDGQLWVGALNSAGWQIDHVVSDKLLVKALVGDTHGTIWCATDSDGVAKITPARKAITRPLLPELAATLCITNDVALSTDNDTTKRYIVGGNSGAWEICIGSTIERRTEPLFPNLKVWDILRREDGTIWAATQSGLHIRSREGVVRHVGAGHPIMASPNRFLHVHRGAVILGTINGVVAIEGSQDDVSVVESLGDHQGEAIGYAYCVLESGLGTNLEGSRLGTNLEESRLGTNLEESRLGTNLEERNGSLLVGTLGRGLWRKNDDHFVQILGDGLIATGNTPAVVRGDGCFIVSQDDRLVRLDDDGTSRVLTTSDEAVMGWAITFDSRNRLWVGSPSGLKCFDSETGELLRDILVWMGRSGWEFTTSRSLVAGEHGVLLCGLNSGLAIVDPDRLERLNTPPIVGLDAVRWLAANPTLHHDGSTANAVPVYGVDRGPWSVEIDVNARTLVDDGTTTFRFLLDGFDRDWSPRSPFASTRYSSLPVGLYRLMVQAHSPLSGWGDPGVVLEIDVRPSTWRESDDPTHLVALLEDRVRISRDLHDNVVQRLFATGMALDVLLRRVAADEAAGISRIIEQLDETIAEVRRAVFSLGSNDEERQGSLRQTVLELAARAEELGGLSVVPTVDVAVDTQLSSRIGAEMLSVIREALSNVVRHSHATRAYLLVEVGNKPEVLRIVVDDDGVGIDAQASDGNGLRNLRSRAVSIGGSLEIVSSRQSGTRLTWVVPVVGI